MVRSPAVSCSVVVSTHRKPGKNVYMHMHESHGKLHVTVKRSRKIGHLRLSSWLENADDREILLCIYEFSALLRRHPLVGKLDGDLSSLVTKSRVTSGTHSSNDCMFAIHCETPRDEVSLLHLTLRPLVFLHIP